MAVGCLALQLARPAGAEEVRKVGSTILRDDGRPTAADNPEIRRMLNRTGDVAPAGLDDPGTRIRTNDIPDRREDPAPSPQDVPRAEGRVVQADRVDPRQALGPALDREVNRLRACRGELAAANRGSSIRAGKLSLRFTVTPDGSVRDSEVVTLTDTDPRLLECVQRKVEGWRFLNTAGKAFDVTRTLTFVQRPGVKAARR